MIEPLEEMFSFSELDEVIRDARSHDFHFVLLWFDSLKNALSTYTPSWVKTDIKRFPRVYISEARTVVRAEELLSPFNQRAWEANAKAFATLMRYLKEFDANHGTVTMIQIENGIGLLGDSRDRSKVANKLFMEPVPKDIIQHLQAQGSQLHLEFRKRFPSFQRLNSGVLTWAEAFGKVSG